MVPAENPTVEVPDVPIPQARVSPFCLQEGIVAVLGHETDFLALGLFRQMQPQFST